MESEKGEGFDCERVSGVEPDQWRVELSGRVLLLIGGYSLIEGGGANASLMRWSMTSNDFVRHVDSETQVNKVTW